MKNKHKPIPNMRHMMEPRPCLLFYMDLTKVRTRSIYHHHYLVDTIDDNSGFPYILYTFHSRMLSRMLFRMLSEFS